MTISILQTATSTSASGSSSVNVTLTVSAGSVLHVYGTWNLLGGSGNGTLQATVTDTNAQTIPPCKISQVDNGTQALADWYTENNSTGSTIVTLTISDVTTNIAIYVEEIGGLPTTGTLVGKSTNSQAIPGTGTDAVTSGTALLVTGSKIICGVCVNAAIGTVPTVGAGFTSDATNPTWLSAHARQESLVTSSGGNTAATFTAATGTDSHLTLMSVFSTAVSKATGGYISNDGTYTIHTFIDNRTFTPSQSLTVDSLVVAGGGGGGSDPGPGQGGGGGGGGGGLYTTGSSVTAQAYTVTIGAGGTSTATAGGTGNNGGDSSISVLSLTATGGGGGANTKNGEGVNGANGGSGGGASSGASINSTGGSGVGGQGSAGGNCTVGGAVTNPGGGGGGGAGAAGQTSTVENQGGAGGDGISNSISGFATYYGGGGGGAGDNGTGLGPGGKGGGGNGNGSVSGFGLFGAPNSGGGGGGTGSDSQTSAGTGGSGIVVIRYLIGSAPIQISLPISVNDTFLSSLF